MYGKLPKIPVIKKANNEEAAYTEVPVLMPNSKVASATGRELKAYKPILPDGRINAKYINIAVNADNTPEKATLLAKMFYLLSSMK